MDSFGWSLSRPVSVGEQLLAPVASIGPSGDVSKAEWPYAVGQPDFSLFDTKEIGPSVDTIYSNSVPAGAIQDQLCGLDKIDTALGPLQRFQQKWGIRDRRTRGGVPAKKRGPKPDSKPAMTRRQELNRQAQRTHRERKENYMRELEIAIDKYKSLYQDEIGPIREENKKLRELLTAHGIPHDFPSPMAPSFTPTSPMLGIASTPTSINSGYTSGFDSPLHTGVSSTPYSQCSPTMSSLPVPRSNVHGFDYADIALDFVGSYGRNPYLSPPQNAN